MKIRLNKTVRSAVSILMALALLAGAVLIAPVPGVSAETAVNLVTNGDFETGTLDGWTVISGVANTAPPDGYAISGTSARINAGGAIRQMITVEPGAEYLCSVQYHSTSKSGTVMSAFNGATISVATKYFDAFNTDSGTYNNSVGVLTATFVAKGDQALIRLQAGGSNISVFDNLRVVKVSRSGLAVNGDFETETLDGWTIISGVANTAPPAGYAISGISARINAGGAIRQMITVEPGAEYFCTVQYRSTSKGGTIMSAFDGTTISATTKYFDAANTDNGTFLSSVGTLSATFVAKSSQVSLRLQAGGSNISIFDNLRIVKVERNGLVKNGNFGTGALDFWTVDKTVTAEDGGARLGAYASLKQTLAVTADTLYAFSFDYAVDTANTMVRLNVWDAAGAVKAYTEDSPAGPGSGTISGYFSAGANTTVILQLYYTGGNGEAVIDNVYMDAMAIHTDTAKVAIFTDEASILTTADANDKQALRFIHTLNTTAGDTVTVDSSNLTILSVGALFASETYLNGRELTLQLADGTKVQNGETKTYRSRSESGSSVNYTYTAIIRNISQANAGKNITCRAYLLCKDDSGKLTVVYGKAMTTSVKGMYNSIGSGSFGTDVQTWMGGVA